ncbi:regulatory protein RecX [Ichthyobacterium seriolicida]|uniref:Regulatory protein RecX n=1 Tax=Ichthyobacterium seriolicida TaxID=242600 RepID=A0A1J1E3R3_9FLAO|nr:regulatory protein RecX [Ichthyobacterium seriolicida]BAV94692.1 RecX-type transcriptional regulator [Ichthyobacterium seriolicida]
MEKYCSYQERCHKEVEEKLYQMCSDRTRVDEVVLHLLERDFLNEERFAKSFVRGKFCLKKWGKVKIISELKRRSISEHCIKKGLEEIDTSDYHRVLIQVLEKKSMQLGQINPVEKKHKVINYLISRGFEIELIHSVLDEGH